MKKFGNLFLIPTYLSESNDNHFLSPLVKGVVQHTKYFLVENAKTARRFIKNIETGVSLEKLHFEVLNKYSKMADLDDLFKPIKNDSNLAVISEAGYPCLADPGHLAVQYAHRSGIQVRPLPGSSSILLSVACSGFSGQQFTFHGYLPIEKHLRRKKINMMERKVATGYTQVFMETPYRNQILLKDLTHFCHPEQLLGIAIDVTGTKEFILTQEIHKWKSFKFDFHKLPAIFSLGQFSDL